MKTHFALAAIFFYTAVAGVRPAQAVQVYNSTPANETAAGNGLGWSYTGRINGDASGVYLGKYADSYYVLTANHVGGGGFSLGGNSYDMVAGSYQQVQSGVDLGVFAITGGAPLDALTNLILGSTLFTTTPLNMIGYGGGIKRGGYNTPDGYAIAGSPGYSQKTIVTDYDMVSGEAQAITLDSGGGVFYQNGPELELAGVMIGVNTVMGTDYTFSVDVKTYRTQILSRVPEASTVASWSVLGVFALGLIIRRKISSAPR